MEAEIRDKLSAYLRGDVTLKELRAWLAQRTWNQEDVPKVAYAAAYFIDEAASGNVSKSKLDDELRRLAARQAAVARR